MRERPAVGTSSQGYWGPTRGAADTEFRPLAHDRSAGEVAEPAVGRRGPTSERSTADLVRAAGAGDSEAWDALVHRFASTVWAVARAHRLNTSDAADVSQTTWMRLVENLDRIQQPDRVGAWLATTARRESLRLLRLSGRQVPGRDHLDAMPDPRSLEGPEHNVAVHDRACLINRLVETLPVKSRLLLQFLSAASPLSYKDISEALDMPIGSIGPTRARALEHLRRLAVQAGLEAEDVFA